MLVKKCQFLNSFVASNMLLHLKLVPHHYNVNISKCATWRHLRRLLRYDRLQSVVPTLKTRTGIGARVWSDLSVVGDHWSYDSHFSKKAAMSLEKRHDVIFSKSKFSFWNTFWTILNRFRSKTSKQKNFLCNFSTFYLYFSKKMAMSPKKSHNWKLFQKGFCFKIRFGPFWIDSN